MTDTPGFDLEPINTSGRAAHLTAAHVDTAMMVLAMSPTAKEAAARLTEMGTPRDAATLNRWRRQFYPNRYRRACELYQTQVEQIVVQSVRGLAHSAAAAAQLAVDLERERIEAGDVKDAAASARNLATTVGIATDKLLVLTNRPTAITETRSADDVLRALDERGYVDSTASEEE